MVEQKIETIREAFQAAKVFCATENDLEKITAYCETADKEFRSIAYEAASMQIALRDLDANNNFENWKYFADNFGDKHATQIYVGLGWAVAQNTAPLEKVIADLPELLKYRVADGCGYYDGTFRNRQTVRLKQLPDYVSGKNLKPYFQGIGRSLWYSSKADAEKTNELLLSFDKQYHADMWRGVGIALAYVGGCDEAIINNLKKYSGTYLPQFACGIALAACSRSHSYSLTADIELCSEIVCRRSAEELVQLTEQTKADDYFFWLEEIEEKCNPANKD